MEISLTKGLFKKCIVFEQLSHVITSHLLYQKIELCGFFTRFFTLMFPISLECTIYEDTQCHCVFLYQTHENPC